MVAVECLCTWSWLADLCAAQGLPFVLGPALSMQAIHGGTATNEQSASQKIAALLRGGRLPPASVYPAGMRATRALLRRRPPLRRTRADRLAPVQHTNAQSHRPAIGQQSAYKAKRAGVAARVPEPAVQQHIAVDLALITSDDQLLSDLERSSVTTAKQPDAHTLSRLQTGPGLGKLLRLVRLYEIPQIDPFPRGQDFVAYCRLVTCAQDSAGTRVGTAGQQIGQAHLTWAFSDAAALFLRNHEPGQKYLARVEKKPDQGKALTLLAHQLARAVYDMLKRKPACDMDLFLPPSGAERVRLAPHGPLTGAAASQRARRLGSLRL